MTDAEVLCAIATEIEAARPRFPQLAEFSARTHCDAKRMTVSYQYRCEAPSGGPGWGGSTPVPDREGIWLYLDFHDPDSTAQIHTQPVTEPRTFRNQSVMLLLREGGDVPPFGPELEAILERHGVTSA